MRAEETAQFAGCDPASVKLHLAIEREIANEKTKGNAISYHEAHHRVLMAQDPASTFDPVSGALVVTAADQSADPESLRIHLAIQKEQATEKAKGNSIPYQEAHRRIEMARPVARSRDGLVLLAGAEPDPASLEFHKAILALIEKERLAGRTITFLEAARRVEREQAKG